MNAPFFSDRQFRDTLGLFASGVVVVTSTTPTGARLGVTVSSFSSLSLDPPLVLFSLSRNAKSFAAWEVAEHFVINVLAEHQSSLSTRFARASIDKWANIEFASDQYGSPVLSGALAVLSCTAHARFDGGDHLILVGKVNALTSANQPDRRPLIFYGGSYRRLDSEFAIQTPTDAIAWLQGW